jgi:hypothetical protein
VVGTSEQGSEPLGFIKCMKFLKSLRNY